MRERGESKRRNKDLNRRWEFRKLEKLSQNWEEKINNKLAKELRRARKKPKNELRKELERIRERIRKAYEKKEK